MKRLDSPPRPDTLPRVAEMAVQPSSRVGIVPRGVSFEAVAAFAVPALAVGGLAAAEGGYFETSWGWSALAFLWLASVALALRRELRTSRLELLAVGALSALLVWTAASALWSISSSNSVREAQRLLVYVGCVVAVLALVSPGSIRLLLAGVLAGATGICAYATATRLFPDSVQNYDPIAVYRLSEPLGYWNALSLLAALGVLVGLGLSARATTPVGAALAAATLPLLGITMLFTFGRGAWLALAAGLAAMLVLSPRRAELATTLAALSAAPAVAVLIAARFEGLTHQSARLPEIEADGRTLAWLLAALTVAAGVIGAARAAIGSRVRFDEPTRLVYSRALGAVAIVAASMALVLAGGPAAVARHAYDSYREPPPEIDRGENVTGRLLSLSSNGRNQTWSIAWDGFTENAVVGLGAGGYEFLWNQRRETQLKVRDAHGLYQEMLAELGVVGLIVLLAALAAPVAAAVKARRHPLAPVALGAFAAYLVHAGFDWDWEMPAVTVAGLVCATALLLMARGEETLGLGGRTRVAGSLVAAGFGVLALVGWIGATALTESAAAAERGDRAEARAKADKAVAWAPWSSEALRLQAEARVRSGDLAGAAESFRAAIDRSPRDWRLWLGLGVVTKGNERRAAAAEARRLNPKAYIARTLILRERAGR